ncbi:MAG: hypothetical protein ACLR0U_03550 [Enterocloster clostridioformis]
MSRVWRFRRAQAAGSRWITYKVVYKDGKEISREQDHKTTYKGHAPVIRHATPPAWCWRLRRLPFPQRQHRQSLTECRTAMFRVMRQPPYLPGTVHGRIWTRHSDLHWQRPPQRLGRRQILQVPQPSENGAAGPGGDNPVIAPLAGIKKQTEENPNHWFLCCISSYFKFDIVFLA